MRNGSVFILTILLVGFSANAFAQCTPPTANISGNVTICAGESADLTITFTGTAPWSFTYTDGSVNIAISGINSSPYVLSVSPDITTTYSLVDVTDINCTNTASGSATVTVNLRPTAMIDDLSEKTICIGAEVELTGPVTATGDWELTLNSGDVATGTNNGTFSITVNPLDTFTYKIASLIDANCFAFPTDIPDSQLVEPTTPPTVDKPADQIVCDSASTATITFTGSGKKYTWTNDQPSIGLAASGTGDIGSFPAINNSIVPVVATITVTPRKGGCKGTVVTFTITVNPKPKANITSNDTTICVGSIANIKGDVTAAGSWTLNLSPGGSTSGIGNGSFNIPVAPAITSNYTIASLTAGTCIAKSYDLTDAALITVNPSPTVDKPADQIVCNGVNTTKVTFTGTGTTYSWTTNHASIGLGNFDSTSVSEIPVFTAVNTGISPIIATIIVTPEKNGCVGAAQSFTITVNPQLKAWIDSGTTSICNGTSTNIIGTVIAAGTWVITLSPNGSTSGTGSTFSIPVSPASETIYTIASLSAGSCNAQSNDLHGADTVKLNPPLKATITGVSSSICYGDSTVITGTVEATGEWEIKLLPSGLDQGTGNTSFNVTVFPTLTTTYTIDSLTVEGCAAVQNDLQGSQTVIVNPLPSAIILSSDTGICNGAIVNIEGTVTATGAWSLNLSPDGSASGNGDGAFSIPVSPATTSTYKISSLSSGICNAVPGDLKDSVVITVSPIPTVNKPSDQIVCNGASTTNIIFSGTASMYSWTNDLPSIGLASSGTGNINSFTAVNDSAFPVVATITVTPQSSQCVGLPQTFTITVNPSPELSSAKNFTVCDDAPFVYQATSATDGTSFYWVRNVVAGISNPFASADSNLINETLDNTTADPVSVTYQFTLGANGCTSPIENVSVLVDPTPKLTSDTIASICSDSIFTYTAISATTNAKFSWSRDAVTGITNPFKEEFDNTINETLHNTTDLPVVVTYEFTLTTADSLCSNIQLLQVTVNPTPKTNPVSNKVACQGETVNAIHFTSNSPDASFSWTSSQDIGLGISGTDSIQSFVAKNTDSVPVTSIITVSIIAGADGCPGPDIFFTVTVNPIPVLTSATDTSICSGSKLGYEIESSFKKDVLYRWTSTTIPVVTGNSSQVDLSTNNLIDDLLVNSLNDAIIPVDYQLTLSYANGGVTCASDTDLTVNVNPSPPLPSFTSLLPNTDTIAVCGGSDNINFNIDLPDTAGVTYQWSATPPDDVVIRSITNPNTVISFGNSSGIVVINATAFNSSSLGSCSDSVSQVVIIQNSNDSINERKIILKQPGNLLVYPDNSMNVGNGYQWGYDVKINDTTLSAPHEISNQMYQVFVPASEFLIDTLSQIQLDTFNYCFWVLLKRGDCQSKVYYNGPYAPKKIAADSTSDPWLGINVFPNPATGSFNITLHGKIYGEIETKIYNTLGEIVFENSFTKKLYESTQKVIVKDFPNGIYYLELRGKDKQKISTRVMIAN